MKDPLYTKIRALPPAPSWSTADEGHRRAMISDGLRILRAACAVSDLTVEDIAANARAIVSVDEAMRRRVVRAALGVCGRLHAVSPQALQIASGGILARGVITDGAVWGARIGYERCRPMIVDIMAAFKTQPRPCKSIVRELLASAPKVAPAVQGVPPQRNESLFSTSRGRHEDDPNAANVGIRVLIPVEARYAQ